MKLKSILMVDYLSLLKRFAVLELPSALAVNSLLTLPQPLPPPNPNCSFSIQFQAARELLPVGSATREREKTMSRVGCATLLEAKPTSEEQNIQSDQQVASPTQC